MGRLLPVCFHHRPQTIFAQRELGGSARCLGKAFPSAITPVWVWEGVGQPPSLAGDLSTCEDAAGRWVWARCFFHRASSGRVLCREGGLQEASKSPHQLKGPSSLWPASQLCFRIGWSFSTKLSQIHLSAGEEWQGGWGGRGEGVFLRREASRNRHLLSLFLAGEGSFVRARGQMSYVFACVFICALLFYFFIFVN